MSDSEAREGVLPDQARRAGAPERYAGPKLRIVTRCRSLNEFFAKYSAMTDGSSIFITTAGKHPIGARRAFSIALSQGETVMRGEGEVVETREASAGVLPGIRLKLVSVDGQTRAMHDQLLARTDARANRADTWRPPADSRRDVKEEPAPSEPVAAPSPSSSLDAATEDIGPTRRHDAPLSTLIELGPEDQPDSMQPVVRLCTPARTASAPLAAADAPPPQIIPHLSTPVPLAAPPPPAPNDPPPLEPDTSTTSGSPPPSTAAAAERVAGVRNRPALVLGIAVVSAALVGLGGGGS